MKKLFIAAVILMIAASGVYSQQADTQDAAGAITDETDIILDDTAPAADTAEADNGRFFTTWDFIKVILILAAVILIIYAIFYGLKKAGGLKYQNDNLIRLLGSQSLTQNGSVHLIEVGAKYYLVGCGDSTVTHIADIEDKETVDEIMLKHPPEQDQKKTFADMFNFRIGARGSDKGNLQDKIKNNNKFMHDQAERLKKM